MKKTWLIAVIITGVLTIGSPAFGHGPYYGYHGYRYHGWGYYSGWDVAAIVGGSLVLGTLLGMALTSPYCAYPPRTFKVYPEPQRPYAAPDPAFIERYSKEKTPLDSGPGHGSSEIGAIPPGTWVTVPGQWVSGAWVPSHQVWVPENK